MKLIDHNPNENKKPPPVFAVAFGVCTVLLVGGALTRQISWVDFALGVACGGFLACWAIEITGNRIPDSWRGKTTRSGRPGT